MDLLQAGQSFFGGESGGICGFKASCQRRVSVSPWGNLQEEFLDVQSRSGFQEGCQQFHRLQREKTGCCRPGRASKVASRAEALRKREYLLSGTHLCRRNTLSRSTASVSGLTRRRLAPPLPV